MKIYKIQKIFYAIEWKKNNLQDIIDFCKKFNISIKLCNWTDIPEIYIYINNNYRRLFDECHLIFYKDSGKRIIDIYHPEKIYKCKEIKNNINENN